MERLTTGITKIAEGYLERREERRGALLILQGRVSTYVPQDSSKRSRPLLSTPLPSSTRPPTRILKDSTSTRLISVRGEAMVAIGENEIRITVDLCIVDGTSHLERS